MTRGPILLFLGVFFTSLGTGSSGLVFPSSSGPLLSSSMSPLSESIGSTGSLTLSFPLPIDITLLDYPIEDLISFFRVDSTSLDGISGSLDGEGALSRMVLVSYIA